MNLILSLGNGNVEDHWFLKWRQEKVPKVLSLGYVPKLSPFIRAAIFFYGYPISSQFSEKGACDQMASVFIWHSYEVNIVTWGWACWYSPRSS